MKNPITRDKKWFTGQRQKIDHIEWSIRMEADDLLFAEKMDRILTFFDIWLRTPYPWVRVCTLFQD